jgi:hypothetical protein
MRSRAPARNPIADMRATQLGSPSTRATSAHSLGCRFCNGTMLRTFLLLRFSLNKKNTSIKALRQAKRFEKKK